MTQPSLEEIKKVDWQYLVDRKESVLISSSIFSAAHDFKKITLVQTEVINGLNANNGSLFYSKQELDKMRTYFSESDNFAFRSFIKNMLPYFKKLDKYTSNIEKIDFSDYNNLQLNQEIEKFFEILLKPLNFFVLFAAVDGALSNRILNSLPNSSEEEKQKWLFTLTYPKKENEHVKEQKSFFKLIRDFRTDGKGIEKSLNNHLKNFSWMGTRWFWLEDEWKREDVITRINNFISENKSEEKELAKLESSKSEASNERIRLIKEIKIPENKSFLKLLDIAQEFAFLRTYRSDILYRAGHRAVNLFREISRRAGLSKGDFVYLTNEEIIKMSKTNKCPVSNEEIEKRKESYSVLLLNGKISVLSGLEWKNKLQFLFSSQASNEIKGYVAFPGKIRGKARLVFYNKDIKKVQRGDILVAVMTFPSFIPAMEKASAFVTDEGGILCHAAIVSREMKKPCIIGTKNATKLLKDGDLIEVDADKGTIKKL